MQKVSRTYFTGIALVAVAVISGASCESCAYYDPYWDCGEYYDDAYDDWCNYNYIDPFVGDDYLVGYTNQIPEVSHPHENPDIEAQPADDTIRATLIGYVIPREGTSNGISPTAFEEQYPCDGDGAALTLCANASAASDDSPRILVLATTAAEIPRASETYHYVIGLAFDSDNDESNNYTPPSERANHYWGGTDRWYTATYDPASGWRLEVFDASSGEPVSATSNARLVFQESTLALVVPASEFPAENPSGRLTLFRHTGEFGEDGADWSGFLFPSLEDGLSVPSLD